ncbi:site-2 protease family protein [Streptomyces sp. NPDC007905]|uniref:site-2 protease family protein n=1 Tax=Streptomyces sp. NPDC007905 TaxID=3364788 RepID=UPI0036E87C24
MKGSVRVGSVRGVAVWAHWSVPLIMLFFAYGLAHRTLPGYAPGLAPVVYAVAGVVGALLLLVSLVVHEAAHALTARRAGIPVRDVTLWALGGLTRMDRPTTARTAFAVAVSGPLASLLLGGVGLGAAAGAEAALGRQIPVAVLGWLGGMNLLLGVFNLLPATPLDGGRVLQAVLWWRTGDRERAQRAAGRSGQVLGVALGAVGWLAFVRGVPGGLWLTVIGLFVAGAAAAERRWAELSMNLRGVRVAEAMTTPVVAGPDWMTVDRFLTEVAAGAGHSVLPVLDFDGRPSGVVRLRRLAAVPSGQRDALRVRDLATPLSQCTLAASDELLNSVLERLGTGGGLPILVMDGGHLDGIVTAHDIDRSRRAPRRPLAPGRPGRHRDGVRPLRLPRTASSGEADPETPTHAPHRRPRPHPRIAVELAEQRLTRAESVLYHGTERDGGGVRRVARGAAWAPPAGIAIRYQALLRTSPTAGAHEAMVRDAVATASMSSTSRPSALGRPSAWDSSPMIGGPVSRPA